MTDYTEFDKALLAEISRAPQSFGTLTTTPALIHLARPLRTTSQPGYPTPLDRIFDRRLQALRRAGQIRYSRGKWEVVER